MAAINKDVVLVFSLVLSVVSLVLLFGVTWYFQSSLDLLQQEAEHDRELLFKLQEQINVAKFVLNLDYLRTCNTEVAIYTYIYVRILVSNFHTIGSHCSLLVMNDLFKEKFY